MPVRTNGGVFCDQVLTGSLQHFRVIGADFTGAIDSNNMPVHGSAAEIIYTELSRRATISIMNPITNPLGMSFALETNRAAWTAAEIEVLIRSMGTIGVDNVDVSNVAVEQVYYNLIPSGSGATTFLDLTDTPSDYSGEGGKVLAVTTTEDGIEFVTVSGAGLVDSVFGRIGDVVAQDGDYDASQITYDNTTSGLSAINVQLAIDEIDTNVDTNITNITNLDNRVTINEGDITNLQNQLSNLSIDDLTDVDITTVPPSVGQILEWDGTNFVPGDKSISGATTFLGLSDTPPSYAGESGNALLVNATEDGVEFSTIVFPVTTVFGRTGDVIAQSGDYDASLIDYDNSVSGLSSVDVQSAIDELDGNVDINTTNITNIQNQLGNLSIDDLTDVDTSTTPPSIGQILEWDGTNFVPGDKSQTGATTFLGLSDTPIDYSGQSGKTVNVNSTEDGLIFVDSVQTVFDAMKEPTGIVDRAESSIEFDESTRVFTIQPVSTSFTYYIHGKKFVISSVDSITVPDTTGLHYIYYDQNGVMQTTMILSSVLFTDNALVCIIYWNSTLNQSVYTGDERHGITMDGSTHFHFHVAFGTQYITGLALSDIIVDASGDLDAHAQFSANEGIIRDEDLNHNIVNLGNKINDYDLEQDLYPIAQIPVLYRFGAQGEWRTKKPGDNFPLIYSGDSSGYIGANGRPPFNENISGNWVLSEVPHNDYFLMHYFATNDFHYPIIAIQGISSYLNRPQAQAAATTELGQLTGLPFAEFYPIATVIFETRDTYSNTPKSRIVSTSDGQDYIDWRDVETFGSQIVHPISDHGSLGGLLDDDHPQYLNRDGSRAMTGDMDVGGNDVINVGLVDGRDVSVDGSTLDSHIADNTIHYPQSAISITESQISDLQPYLLDITNESLSDLADVDTSGIQDGQGLVWNSTLSKWVPADFVQVGDEEILFNHNGSISQTISTTFSTILFESSVRTTTLITYNTGQFTVNADGWYTVEFDLSFTTTTNSRKNSQFKLQVDGVDVPGSVGYTYNRNAINGESTGSAVLELNLTTGQILTVVARGTTGTIKTLANGCRIRIKAK